VLLPFITTAQRDNNLFAAQAETTTTTTGATSEYYEVVDVNIVVMWYNKLTRYDACNDDEYQFISDMIAPNLNFQLSRDGISALPWQSERGHKNGQNKNNNNNNRDLQSLSVNCTNCKRQGLSDSTCNAMYNCGLRRRLRIEKKKGVQVDLKEVGLRFNYICMNELEKLSSNPLLSDTCKVAVKDSICETLLL